MRNMGSGVEPGPSRADGPIFPTEINWKMDNTKMTKLCEMVENTISTTRKALIDSILQQTNQLNDMEKFLLYLKLPIGRSPEPDPLKKPINPLGSRNELQSTSTWIKTHLMENVEYSLLKEDVYGQYLRFCEKSNVKQISKADFGKLMKQIFPSANPRRLGRRGESRYTYSGMSYRMIVDPPALPDLTEDCLNGNVKKLLTPAEEEKEKAAITVIFEFIEKMHNIKCPSIRELALHLVQNSLVDKLSKSAQKLLNDHKTIDQSMGKQQLRRSLHEKEQLREQKRKHVQESSGDVRMNSDRPKSRRRSGKTPEDPNKKNSLVNNNLDDYIADNKNANKSLIKKEPESFRATETYRNSINKAESLCMPDCNRSIDHNDGLHILNSDQSSEWNRIEDLSSEKYEKPEYDQIRKMLVANLSTHNTPPNIIDDQYESAKRRVSFQNPGCNSANLSPGITLGSSTQTPLSFTPIHDPHTVSQNSSTNTSPFMSPTNTPLHRSRNNSGQTSSTYITPRSTPFTPDIIGTSENSTPFMSPAPTPLRSRHNSSQNSRAFTQVKSRHSSGTLYRHTPYQDDMSRRSKFRPGHASIQSAPPSPLVSDVMITQPDLGSPADAFQGMLKNRTSVFNDIRKRHVSAGAVVYQSNCNQSGPHVVSHFDLEVSQTLSNSVHYQPSPTQAGSSARPQSVPLPQMITGTPDAMAKSYPTTPICNQQFDFGDSSMSSSYNVTPVPSVLADFSNCNLGLSDEPEQTYEQNNSTLSNINPSIQNIDTSLDLSFQDNNFNSNLNQHTNFLQNVEGTTFTNCQSQSIQSNDLNNYQSNETKTSESQLMQSREICGNPQITLNALNSSQSSIDLNNLDAPTNFALRNSNIISEDYGQSYSITEQDDFLFED